MKDDKVPGEGEVLAQIVQQETAALKHQLHRFLARSLAPVCAKCVVREKCEWYRPQGTCTLAEEYQESIRQAVGGLEHILPQDGPLVLAYAKAATGLAILDLWLSEETVFAPGQRRGVLSPQPALKYRVQLVNELINLSNALLLSPAARLRVAKNAGMTMRTNDLAALLVQVEEDELADRNAEALEGEVEEDPKEGGKRR
jgi:hypothetical protein